MDTVLADALLSQCRDADALLRAVGGEDGALSAERAESLRLLLQRAAAASGGWRGEAAQKRVAREAALGRCLRTLLGGGGAAAGESPQEWRRVVRAVCGALHCCAALCGSPLAEQLAREALHACEGTGWRQVEAAVEILAAVAPWLREPALLKRSAGLALGLLWGEEEENEEKAVLVAGRLLPALGRNGAALGHVWEGLMLPPETAPQRASRALLVLSALSDAVFPAGVLDARLCSSFWTVVQKGLTENDALCRKRARYLLKRAVDLSEKLRGECRCSQDPGNEPCLFWWCAEQNEQLTHFWENYILIMETLEGNQIHVIKPVLPKLNSLYEYAVSKHKGCWLLHPSWHMCIYQRMFDSENKTLTKEGIIHFLEIWQTKDLPTSPEFSEFIIGPLMDALSESSLYSRASGQIIGTFPPLGMKLQKFLATFFTNLPDKEKSDFLLKFIQKMSNRHWCAVPILFLSMALAHIPAYRALDGEGLLALREVLQCTMITHQILLRGAAQCYLLEAAIHLTDTEKVSLSDISNFIICLRPDESLGRGTVLFLSCRRNRICFPHCLKFLLSSGNGCTERIELKRLLNPLLDILLKLGTNPYISSLKADKSLHLLLKLLQLCSVRCSRPQWGFFFNFHSSLEEQASHQGWGKIVARYIRDQWVCLHFTLNNYQNVSKGKSLEQFFSIQKCTRTLQSALEAIMILPSDHVLPVFRCMQILISKLLESAESLCIETFDLAWKIIFSLSNTQLIFWPNLKAFVQFVFDPEVLAAAAKSKSQAYTKIKEVKCFKPLVLSLGLYSWWIHSYELIIQVEKAFSNASNYSELLIEGCLFGTVFRRDQSTNRDDHYVRVCAIKFLCLLDELNTLHKKFIEDFVMKLLDKAEFMSKTKNRYYVNSLQHRIKNRLWQTLLVMFPKLHEVLTIDRILQAAHSNNQASVKYLIEWNIILILHKFPQFFPKFWDCFDYGEDHLKTSICTFLAVLSHFDIILQDTCEKVALKKALVVVLKWCFHHNFSVRLYALMALKKIWGMCKASCMNDFETLAPVIESSLNQAESMHGTGNAKKNWQRIQKHFFFENFHPLNDYCLETIFYALPRLSEIAEEEWIPLSKFTAFTDIPRSSTFPCYYSQTTLLDLKPSDWSQQDMGKSSLSEPGNQRQWTDVQKKIIPWKDSALDLDLELEFQDRTKLGKSSSKLIVVASLIDKPTNLGGLCRTCEIFGVSALIVGSLHCIKDKQFQYLSVSAEQWLSLVEVKPFQLIDYLEQKKIEGYTIIGVEQTAKSCDLTEYQFPEKSLLLLGNEHEGIPANLIQQLDTCVEIPQQGVIRSLNVHVSGALLIWEYTRQQIIKENKER
uniref:tRNA (guanosine(18)-2'-O)-methyltransferase TARBP1 n=1 Tax=Varanus komodoensis TaxID=61221 RepID=A0A8D2LUT4_VARKO